MRHIFLVIMLGYHIGLFGNFYTTVDSLGNDRVINYETKVTGLEIPVDIAFDHNDILYIVEKRGIIKRVLFENGNAQISIFLDIDAKVNSGANERGLLGLVFHPDYKNNGYFFVNYTNASGSTVIERYSRSNLDESMADVNSAKFIMSIVQPYNNHNGGDLNFGADGYLYIGMGDGGSGGDPQNFSQNKLSRLGKMLRVDIDTSGPFKIPVDNPFINDVNYLPEIWSLGLRNPWRFSFDLMSGEMWIADVGQNRREEINIEPKIKGGRNYGWRCFEGELMYNFADCNSQTEFTAPIHTYVTSSSGEGCSITGGYVYRGPKLENGNYIYGDFCSGNVWMLRKNECENRWINEKIFNVGPQELSTFGQDSKGDIYFAELASGIVNKMIFGCEKIVEKVEVIDTKCPQAFGKVSFITEPSSSYQILINNAAVDLNKLMAGTYSYTIISQNNLCKEYGCFEIKQKDTLLQISPLIDSFVICGGDTPYLTINDFNTTLDSFLYEVKIGCGDQIQSYTVSDSILLDLCGEVTGVYVEGCKYELKDQINVKSISEDSLKVISATETKIEVSGPFSSFILLDQFNTLIEENNSGKFAGNFSEKMYQVKAVDGNCTVGPLVVDITTEIKENKQRQLKVYPNPSQNIIWIDYENIMAGKIIDISGKVLKKFSTSEVNIQDLANGSYIVYVLTTNGFFQEQFIINR